MLRSIVISGIVIELLSKPATAQNQPAAPPPMVDAASDWGGDTIGLNTCYSLGDLIRCKFTITRNRGGPADYTYDIHSPVFASMLYDNYKIPHQLVGGYMINGRDEHVNTINLSKGEWTWFTQDYGGARTDGVDQARIVFHQSPSQPTFELHGPVEKAK
jgi:hypothetical protein